MSATGRNSSRPPSSTSYCPNNSPITIADLNIGGDSSSAIESSKLSQRTRSLGKFFGVQGRQSSNTDLDRRIRPRTLLAATVYHNAATNLWITTINTNQRGVAKDPNLANKYLKAFSFHSEHEARESAIANAPPKMVPLSDSPSCFMCEGKFNVFRRPCHCRNCGVCVCKDCSTSWSAKQIPDTYNLKNKTSVKICKGCDTLSSKFKEALLAGNLEDAIAIYISGNVNLRTPFPERNKKGELIYPVMCAVQGGNLDVVRWLIEDHFCPIKQIQQTGLGRMAKRGEGALITTSKGRTVLSIALEGLQIDILRYFVVDCRMSLHGVADLKTVLKALEATLHSLPSSGDQSRALVDDGFQFVKWDKASFDALSEPSSLGTEDYAENDSIAMKSYRARGNRSDSVRIPKKTFPTVIDVLRQQN
ncbi:hypothetical protein FisN_5Hh358 [Fistulifera solaris]|uniref:FYVE-type domain-containing protein n=1 Tax=Fistulifera solaris TaxID=1519565 RepID=A0A1Z5JSR1_FISSO|nr:hypothetical protein FisN_5Hh358 [Fistulifera solaris]|eukprot:GAX16979.1 hypothetical protein FisN_5Hh358 [Fistulifera solaris]